MNCCGLIVAAGQGLRLGKPKAFVQLLNRPVLAWTLDAFLNCDHIHSIVLVVSSTQLETAKFLAGQIRNKKSVVVCEGGPRRIDSVRNGLAIVPQEMQLVAIHDGARPLITSALIERVVKKAKQSGAAIAAVLVNDTIKKGKEVVQDTLQRSDIWLVQTPQVFYVEDIRNAYKEVSVKEESFITDDSQLIERMGQPVHLVPGDPTNIKITVPEDIPMAEAILRGRMVDVVDKNKMNIQNSIEKQPRIGMGYDVQRLESGCTFVLGGVSLASSLGLVGHSDADVLSHAIGDAILGAANLGDLGTHFPSEDSSLKGISSLILLAEIRKMLEASGYFVGNLDTVVACESPKLSPYIGAMKENIARALNISIEKVSIKATTSEKLGFVGRQQGVAAYATVLIFPQGVKIE